jgi:hypothetical protein
MNLIQVRTNEGLRWKKDAAFIRYQSSLESSEDLPSDEARLSDALVTEKHDLCPLRGRRGEVGSRRRCRIRHRANSDMTDNRREP